MQVVSISEDTGERYTEVISGTEKTAPLLAVYELKIAIGNATHLVQAEVRSSPLGEQIDWTDKLYFTESEGAKTLGELIYRHYCNCALEFPIVLKGGHIDLDFQ